MQNPGVEIITVVRCSHEEFRHCVGIWLRVTDVAPGLQVFEFRAGEH